MFLRIVYIVYRENKREEREGEREWEWAGGAASHGFIQGHACESGSRRQCLFLLQVTLGLTLFPSRTQGESGYMLHCQITVFCEPLSP